VLIMEILIAPLKEEHGTGLKYVRIVPLLSATPYSSVMGLNLTTSPLPRVHSLVGETRAPPRNISANISYAVAPLALKSAPCIAKWRFSCFGFKNPLVNI